ncbi:MAG: hypothetical protein HZA21_04690 [Nitrospirae bacterium]|nr:hypothetical protein [Nitrospirota bacterium]
MVRFRDLGILGAALLLIGCISSEWVHPTKPKGDFTQDWNRCESDVLKDPKLQQGMKAMVQMATERCVLKKGWVMKQVE